MSIELANGKATTILTDRKNKQSAIVVILMVLSLATGLVNQTVLSLGVVACCIYLLFADKLVYAFPFIIFYNELYGQVFGLSVLRIYTCLLIFCTILKIRKRMSLRIQYFIPLGVYFLFSFITMYQHSFQRAVFAFVDVICCTILVMSIIKSENLLKRFFEIYVYVAICAFITGLLVANSQLHGSALGYQYLRFSATFEDPNYMGFFFNVAIFSTLTLKLFKPIARWIIIVSLHIMMLASVSMTAIVVNIGVWLTYLIVSKKIKPTAIIAIGVIAAVVLSAYTYGVDNPDTPILGPVSYRIEEKLLSLKANDLNNVTTGRIDLSEFNFNYFRSLPIIKQLFGGTSVNMTYIDPALHGASHNEYIDLLLNVGYVGAFLMLSFVLWRMYDIWKTYKKTNNDMYLAMFIGKVIWFFYAGTITVFLDYRFLLFYLL